MPILWRYLLKSYFKVLCLCIFTFISVLLVTKFQDMARFASTGAPIWNLCQFILYQIPAVIPFAMPISCLIAAILLFQTLSRSHELTALRATGVGFFPIVLPILIAGWLISLLNLSLTCEVAPKCYSLSKTLAYRMSSLNPLSLLKQDRIVKLKNSYVDMRALKSGHDAEDVIFIMKNVSNQRLAMMVAKKLILTGDCLTGSQVAFISTIDPKKEEGYDHLMIENQEEMHAKSADLSQFLFSNDYHFNFDHLPTRMIRAKNQIDEDQIKKGVKRCHQEIAKRVTIGLAPFTFTLIGIACGLEALRGRCRKRLYWAIGLASSFLICFVMAKSIKHAPLSAVLCYLLPHPILIYISTNFLITSAKNNTYD